MPMRVIRQKIQKLRTGFMQSPNPKKTTQQRNKTVNITGTKNRTQQLLHQQTGTQKEAVREKLSPPLLYAMGHYLQLLFSETNPS